MASIILGLSMIPMGLFLKCDICGKHLLFTPDSTEIKKRWEEERTTFLQEQRDLFWPEEINGSRTKCIHWFPGQEDFFDNLVRP